MKKTLTPQDLMAMITLSRVTVITIFLPLVTVGEALQDAWLAGLMATGAGIILGFMVARLAMRFPDEPVGVFAKEILGPVLGTLAALVLAMFFLAITLLRLRLIALLFATTILPRTPQWAIAGSLLVVSAYGASLGLGALGRAAQVFLSLTLAVVVMGTVLLYASGATDLSVLEPVLSRGLAPLVQAAIVPTFWFVTSSTVALALGALCRPSQGVAPAVAKANLYSGIILTMMAVSCTVTLGPVEARNHLSPVLAIARTVYLEGFVERLDVMLFSVWIPAIAFDVALFLLITSQVLSDTLRLDTRKVVLALPILAAYPACSARIDLFDVRRALTPRYIGIILLVILGLIAIMLVVAVFRGKGGAIER